MVDILPFRPRPRLAVERWHEQLLLRVGHKVGRGNVVMASVLAGLYLAGQ